MSRRRFLAGLSGAALAGRAQGFPAILGSPGGRPSITHGVASGDVSGDGAIVWSRADRASRLVVEWSTTDSFRDARRTFGDWATARTGFTARANLRGLPTGQTIVYRATFEAHGRNASSEGATGRFRTAPEARADRFLVWSADTAGQGFGINRDWGGMRLYETMRRTDPDVFIHCGDTIYADNPIAAEVRLDDGTVWKNVVTPAKSKVAEALDEFRGNYLYNLLDENVRRFNAEIPQIVLWDDHEVRNNWYPQQILDDDRYHEKRVAVLAARAKQAFLEHEPLRLSSTERGRIYRAYSQGPGVDVFALDMRTHRGPNGPNREDRPGASTAFLGAAQLAWLKRGLKESRATWKVIAADMPVGVVVPDGPKAFEAVANGDGRPLGREHEIADLLAFCRKEQVRNLVFVTADVHYCAAHHYDPDRAVFKDFAPFWEFVAGPINAGTFGPNALDDTFGPEATFVGIPKGMRPNRPPSDGLQFFGGLRYRAKDGVLTATLHNLAGETIFSRDLEPQR